jgi:hypothetical protein
MSNQQTKLFILQYIPNCGGAENIIVRAHSEKEARNIAEHYDCYWSNHIRARRCHYASCTQLSQEGDCHVVTADPSKDDRNAELDNKAIDSY